MQGTNGSVRRCRTRPLPIRVGVMSGGRMNPPAAMAELDARLSRLESSYEALEETLALPAPGPTSAGAESTAASSAPLYSSVEAWVAGWFAPPFARRLGTTRWCAQWWLHAEAIVRLEAPWRSWETLRLAPP